MLAGWVYDPNHADIMAEQAESARVDVRLQRHPPIAAGRLVLSESRAWELQFNRSVHLESNVWIGVGSQIMSNLTIGVPGGVVREIRDHNHGFYWRYRRSNLQAAIFMPRGTPAGHPGKRFC